MSVSPKSTTRSPSLSSNGRFDSAPTSPKQETQKTLARIIQVMDPLGNWHFLSTSFIPVNSRRQRLRKLGNSPVEVTSLARRLLTRRNAGLRPGQFKAE